MTYVLLACCLPLMAFGATSVVASLALHPVLRRCLLTAEPRSSTLLWLRLAPTLCAGAVAGLVVLPAFLRFEPRQSGERAGPLMLALGATVALVIAAGLFRGVASLLRTRALVRRWRDVAAPVVLPGSSLPAFAIDEEFPLCAVVGILRPRLYVARQVLERCTRDEIAAIVAHETGHVLRRDNLKRLLMRSCPDLLSFCAVGADLESAWIEASDRAADDHAVAQGSRLDLAAALVKVARTLRGTIPEGGTLAAFCREEDLAGRVRRLLRREPDGRRGGPERRSRMVLVACALVAGVVITQEPGLLRGVHAASELVVRILQ
jgi:hypothetical protein